MSTSEPRQLRIPDPEMADAFVAFLAEQGIVAEVRPGAEPGLSGLGALSGFTTETKELWIHDGSQAEAAIVLLQELVQPPPPEPEGEEYEIALQCELCGKQSVFSSKLRGTVQECVHCSEYLDVPDGKEDDFDYGESEEGMRDEG